MPRKRLRKSDRGKFYTDACFTWYESKNELRITRFTKGFPFKGPDYTGALFILIKNTDDDYAGFIFNTEDEMDEFFSAFGLTPAETNRPIKVSRTTASVREEQAINEFIKNSSVDFPSSEVMSSAARMIYNTAFLDGSANVTNPDKALLDWTDEEYKLIKALEQARYGDSVSQEFPSLYDFISLANQVLNRRKNRAGKSLEHHLAAIFEEKGISYTA